MNKEIAILMAAGFGSRMDPLTNYAPKPLVKVHGTSMIETIISGLNRRNVSKIYIVVGYKKEKFAFLETKYSNVVLIENKDYQERNNISSVYAAKDVLNGEDCFICETDLYIGDSSIFEDKLETSCYFGKMVNGYSGDWVFEEDSQTKRIIRVGKGGTNCHNMVGVSYFTNKDAKTILSAIERAYDLPGYEQKYWDEIVDEELGNIDLYVHPVSESSIIEIDTVEELAAVDPDYDKHNLT